MPQILLCGSEGEQFLFENELTTVGADDKRRGSVLLNAGDQMYRLFPSGYADFWVHARIAVKGNTAFNEPANLDILQVLSGSEVLASIRAVTPGSTAIGVLRFDAKDTGPSFPAEDREFINYDIRVRVQGGTTTVYFYRNEVLRRMQSYSGSSLPNAVLIQYQSTSPGQASVWVQDVIITDALPTVGMELATLVPSAVGNYDDFVNDYSAIDDLGYNQSSTISTTTPGDRESWFFADPEFNLGDKVIYGVVMTTVAQTDLAGVITDFEPFLRLNATNYAAPDIGANNIAPNAYVSVWNINPATSAPWNVAELTGLEAGIRAV